MEDEAPDLLLHGSYDSEGDSSAILLGALAAAGIGLLLYSRKKDKGEEGPKKKKRAGKELPQAQDNQVVFNAEASAYEVGASWMATTLEPYLEEKIEEMLLATPEWKTKGPIGWGMTDASLKASMDATRTKVLMAFYISTFVAVGAKQKTIAALPDTEAVRHFKSRVENHTRSFQEEY